jgi:SAM-dependent methyltransferase
LQDSPLEVAILDVGCGTGRYTERLVEKLHSRIKLLCVDLSRDMLLRCRQALERNAKVMEKAFLLATSSLLPCKDKAVDLVMAFNAIHHFDLAEFLSEAVRAIKENGLLAIYTRTPEQNRRTIWGRYFPEFANKENRLHSLDKLEKIIASLPQLHLEEIRFFSFRRHISIQRLRELALAHHYSTFSLYSRDELHQALDIFEKRIKREHGNTPTISHISSNVLILSRRVG